MFYQLLRVYISKDDGIHSNVRNFLVEDFDDEASLTRAATSRFYRMIGDDLDNQNIIYNAAYLIDCFGNIHLKDIYDNRPAPEPEHEPEPEPEPETTEETTEETGETTEEV